MLMIGECIENEDKALTNIKRTTIALNKGGHNFFIAHLGDKERYEKLV
jgi:hypothetical protein